ncbi:MAG: adenylate kinase [Bacteroidales bacterium]|jgi:adenylate kinase|nr:adenylate kinase [Bacteroidales bacterium]MDG1902306.1 adenylate kinase [Bacteroidales bacterium]MDG2081286.1 adenylate kinase [Bacteroidales bacterium]|tara:strand:+ start:20658 stop:21830 length:1173 start_codon:yes stop_codon:yes gene_type:complete
MLNIALFGPPGAGKGTQSKKLLDKYHLTYISTGEILRSEIDANSELGQEAKSIIEAGGLVPDELVVQIIEKKIKENKNARGILFDGFPRTVVQAYILDGLLLKLNTSLQMMISLDVPDPELVDRLLLRSATSGRSDDNLDVIKVRLQEYEEKTKPVASYYEDQGKYHKVNGVGNMDDIFENIVKYIEKNKKKEFTNIVLLGKPGSGKGTQGQLLADKHNLVYISTGKLMREEIKNNTETGNIAKPYMDKGEIVPDIIPIKLIADKINANPKANGFIFKGFPRTIVQAYILDGLLQRVGMKVSNMIELKLGTLEAIKRLSSRGKNKGKARPYDKSTELIINRLEQYTEKTEPVVDFYQKQGKYSKIDADGNQKQVFNKLSDEIADTLRRNF